MYILPKKNSIPQNSFQIIFRQDMCIDFLELCIHYLELKLVILTDVPIKINIYPCYYTKVFRKAQSTFPRKGTFFYCVMQAYYKKNIIDDEEQLFRIPVLEMICHDTKNKIQLCMPNHHRTLCVVFKFKKKYFKTKQST